MVSQPALHFLTQDAAGVFIAVKDKTKPAPEGAILLQEAALCGRHTVFCMSEPNLAEDAFELYVGQKPTGEPDSKKK